MVARTSLAERLGVVTATGEAAADVWFARVGRHAPDVDRYVAEYLSDEERGRVRRYRDRTAAERYVVARSLVRLVLAERMGITPVSLAMGRTATGKPVLQHGAHFNVSHSGDLILLAVCEQRPVGVDVERRRNVARVDALVSRWLTEAERRDMAGRVAAGADPSDAFLRVWSMKEARLKALGVGISGATLAPLHLVDALPLDRLLGALDDREDYVGAIAFA